MAKSKKLLEHILSWVKKQSPSWQDEEGRRHDAYNLFLVVLGLRPAWLASSAIDSVAFSKKFGTVAKIGPYFDVPGKNFAYIINPLHAKRLEPLFQQLEDTYSDDEKLMKRRLNSRYRLIGQILGFPDCVGDKIVASKTYAVTVTVQTLKFQNKTDVFTWLCSSKNIEKSTLSALRLITNAKPHFASNDLKVGFDIVYPY